MDSSTSSENGTGISPDGDDRTRGASRCQPWGLRGVWGFAVSGFVCGFRSLSDIESGHDNRQRSDQDNWVNSTARVACGPFRSPFSEWGTERSFLSGHRAECVNVAQILRRWWPSRSIRTKINAKAGPSQILTVGRRLGTLIPGRATGRHSGPFPRDSLGLGRSAEKGRFRGCEPDTEQA